MTTTPVPDLYATLGIDKSATTDDIKAAYRERVKTAHPDIGGDPMAFHNLVFAKDVLLDPKAREAYDAHGIVPQDMADNATAAILTSLTGMFGQVLSELIQARKDPASGDMVAAMQNALVNGMEAQNKTIAQLENSRAILERMMGRFRVKDLENPNHMETIIAGQVGLLTKQIEATRAGIANMDKAGTYLRGITFLPKPNA